jgi:hypothetical protein
MRDVEDDDLLPISVGGDNVSPLDHWSQEWSQANRKDEIEPRP